MHRTTARLALVNLIAQAGIIVTGVIVRVTGSGLGCPTWPQCVPGSFTPTVQQAQSWHKYVEFGNRMLTFVLVVAAVAVLLAVLVDRKRGVSIDASTLRLAWVPFLGVIAQAVLGGVSVLFALSPVTVMAHFLLSIALVAYSHELWFRVAGVTGEIVQHPNDVSRRTASMVHAGLVILVLGTVVTGTGPHGGDAAAARIEIDPRITSAIHAVAGIAFIVQSVRMYVYARYEAGSARLARSVRFTMELAVLLALVGIVQYMLALPWLLVVAHAALAAGFWIAVLHLRAITRVA